MNITVYLPDALGARAKEAALPLSRLLRAAVERELEKMAEIDRIASTWPHSPNSNPASRTRRYKDVEQLEAAQQRITELEDEHDELISDIGGTLSEPSYPASVPGPQTTGLNPERPSPGPGSSSAIPPYAITEDGVARWVDEKGITREVPDPAKSLS